MDKILSVINHRSMLLVVLCLLIVSVSFSQESDLARIEYTLVPQSNSKNTVNRFRAFINCPLKLGANGSYVIPGIEYRNFDLDIKDQLPFSTDNLGRFQMFRLSLAYTFKIKGAWRLALRTGAELASNFEENQISNRDINFSGAAFLIRIRSGEDVEKPNRFILGLNYSTNAGRPFPLPIINYYRKFNPKWSYSLGSPKTNLKHFWNEKNTVQAFITLDGFFSNIQKKREIPQQDGTSPLVENISMTMVLGGLGYEHGFSKHLFFYAYGGYSFYNEIRIRDSYNNNIYVLNNKNTFYLRTGIKFKI